MSKPGHLTLFFDYVDPASFLMERKIRGLGHPWSSLLVLEPFEVSSPPAELLDPTTGSWMARWTAMMSEGERTGIGFRRPWIVPWTRKAHELGLLARERGCFQEIHDALFRAYLMDGRDIGRIDVLVDLAQSQGLDRTDTKAVLDIDLHRDGVEEGRRRALALGVVRPPALLWSGERLDGFQKDGSLKAFLDRPGENNLNR